MFKINIYDILYGFIMVFLSGGTIVGACNLINQIIKAENKVTDTNTISVPKNKVTDTNTISVNQYQNSFLSYSEYDFHENDILSIRHFCEIQELSVRLTKKTCQDFKTDDLAIYNGLISLYLALISFIYDETPSQEANYETLAILLGATDVTVEDYHSALDLLFKEDVYEPDYSFAKRQYNVYSQLPFEKKKEVTFMANFSINQVLISLNKINLTKPKRKKAEIIDVSFIREDCSDKKAPPTQNEINQAKKQVSINGMNLELLNPELQDNKDVVLSAINGYGWAFKYASDRLKNDKDVVFTAVSNYAYALQYASDELRDDKEIVLKALETNGYALAYASPRLRDNGEVVQKALKEKGRSLRFASERLRKNKHIVDCALATSKRAKDFSLLS